MPEPLEVTECVAASQGFFVDSSLDTSITRRHAIAAASSRCLIRAGCCCFLCPGCYGFEKRNQKRAPPPDTEMAPRTEEPPVVQGNVVETVAAEKK